MEFIEEVADKKTILKQDIGVNPFLLENNINQIEKILNFLKSETPLLLVNGFLGTGKVLVVNQALSFLSADTITLKYNCFETTVLDDILLEFFDIFRKLTAQNVIEVPKARSENFTQKINAYFQSIHKPVVIVINSFEQVLKDNKQEILNFLEHLSGSPNIKIIIISRKFDYNDFKISFDRVAVGALEKGIFEKYLKSEDFKQIGPISDELYKYSRGYYFYTTLSIKIMQLRKLNMTEFLSGYTKSFLTFNDFILREAYALVDPVSGHLFRFLTIMRHPVNVKLLQTLNLYDADKIAYFVDNLILTREGSMIYLQDYYKVIAKNSIADNIAVKIHKSCVDLYNTQLPLKPLERDLLISRQTMRKEIEYHTLFLPKKPVLPNKPVSAVQLKEQKFEENIPETKQQKDEKLKTISFVFETEAEEHAIMNKIANSINSFINITDKKSKDLEEIQKLSLVELVNLAKKEEQNYDYKKVIMIYQKALTMNSDDDYYTFLPTLYTKLAEAFKNLSDWFNSLKYYELAMEFFNSTGDNEKINESKFEIANIYYITFKLQLAEKLLREIQEEDISNNLKIKTKLLLASITGSGVKDALELVSAGVEKNVLAELYFKYALNCDEEGDLESAVKYYKRCIETNQNPKINTFLSSALTNIATIFDEEGKSDSAVKYLTESLRLDEITKNYNGIYISAMKLAEILTVRNPQKALEYFKRAKSCALELNEPFYIASSSVALGDFYFNKKNFEHALRSYVDAHKMSVNNFTKDNILKIEMRINDLKIRMGGDIFNRITKELKYAK